MLKKLFSHSVIYGLAPHVPKIASVFALPIVTKYLTELDYGVSGIIMAVAGAISVFSSLGLRMILVNSFYKSPGQYKWAWRQIYGFLTLWNIPYALILSIILYLFIPIEVKADQWEIIFLNVAPIVFFGPTSTLATTYFQLKQQPLQIAIRTVIFGFLTVLLNIYFIAYKHMGYMGWFAASCIVSMLSSISYWWPLNKKLRLTPIFNFKWRLIKKSLSVSLPTVPHYYAGYLLNSSDRVVMKFLSVPTTGIGLYNSAYTIGNLMANAGIAAGTAVGPLMNQAFKEKKDIVARNLVFILQVAFFAITFILSIWLKEIFFILIKNET
ncbi:MAG TPA: oligosaccharide flippase family protein, partial [Flavisolibacter sp.]|nr:oligosaccharide flippase family protein [Flavisolibacter sp.]